MTRGRKIKGDPFLVAVCAAVHSRRTALGISQEELAERSGLHRTYISDIERGARNPTLKTLSRLAVALEMSASQLVLLAESEHPSLLPEPEDSSSPAGVPSMTEIHWP